MVYLKVIRLFDPWRSPLCTCPRKYSLHPYTGCSHFCLYCYATSYIGRKPSMPKTNFLRNLKHDLPRINKNLVVEMSTSSDPYPPIESWMMLTRKTLELLVQSRVKILITTKSDIVLRDSDLLLKTPSAVMLTITTINDNIAKKLEPGAPPPSKRIRTVKLLSEKNLPVGVRIDPIIPGINDDPLEIKELVEEIADAGARHIVTSTYKARWDNFKRMINAFPELEKYWRKLYIKEGERIHGYIYLPRNIRAKILKPVIDYGLRKGLTVATCREGLGPEYFKAPSCDGTHLIHSHPLLVRK
ncbi:Radical SAM domain protein [Staphylothermus marinus F1]|uniref:Radical SAM domain protein n=1 Tax=Staphylothermus marinus (strain ATCC 43588 / DSM 3639 / JCM 9404 / F1) TaxID=399550 RepID=A3DLI6_STAMF|nr:radical SAM protein [Staphylothermus marinus]ABN69496.1 Radical SAM domain protein [Staphylothermus marinus F1]